MGIRLCVGITASPLQWFETILLHDGNELAQLPKPLCKADQLDHHPLIHGVTFRGGVLHLGPLRWVCLEPLQGVVIALLVHFQVPIDRQRKYDVPDSVQLLLRESCGAVCFFCQKVSSCGDKRFSPSFYFIQDGFIQVHHVYHTLADGKFLPADINMAAIEEHSELIVGVSVFVEVWPVWLATALYLLCHTHHLCIR